MYYVLKNTERLCRKYGLKEKESWSKVAGRLYLPIDKSGLIPQFDGYFNLSQSLETEGGGGNGFQMKNAGGMYHKSQVIKQPDVMVLFSHIHNEFDKTVYERNWDYYEAMCEASSSLTFPVHAICAFDNNQLYKGYQYFMQCAEIDWKDLHSCAKDGVHAGCLAGAWYSIVRGLAGIEMHEDYVNLNPKMLPWWKKVHFRLQWHGISFEVILEQEKCTMIPHGVMQIKYQDKIYDVSERTEFALE